MVTRGRFPGEKGNTIMNQCGTSTPTTPIIWIGGWSIDPLFHPFGDIPSSFSKRGVLTVDLSECQSVDHFVSVVTHTLTDLDTPADIAAWSMGTLLALTVERMFPDRVRRMVLIGATPRSLRSRKQLALGLGIPNDALDDPTARPPTRKNPYRLSHHNARPDHAPKANPNSVSDPPHEPSQIPHWNGSFTFGTSPWTTNALVTGLELLNAFDLGEIVEEVHAPTFLFHGTDDLLCPVERGDGWQSGFPFRIGSR